jgi:hypothetical protein
MNTNFTIRELADWIAGLIDSAKKDEQFLVNWFKPTESLPISIVGGWLGGNYPGVNDDLFCSSKSSQEYIMCIKIIQNEGPYAYTDFEMLSMPTEVAGEVDDTCQLLEWNDDPEQIATFFWGEWMRMYETWECGGYC